MSDAFFEWREIPCASESAARQEAERQQAQDSADAEWIYLRHNGEWVARRTPRDWQPPPETEKPSLTRGFFSELFDPSSWFFGPTS
jgi:hypothetical protein